MNKIMKSLECIDEKYIIEAEKYKKKSRKIWLKGGLAACFCAMAVATGVLVNNQFHNGVNNKLPVRTIVGNKDAGVSSDIIVKELPPIEVQDGNIYYEWKEVTPEALKEKTKLVIAGTIISKKECSMEYVYLDQKMVDYWTVLTVKVDKNLYGDSKEGTINVLYELTSYDAGEFGIDNLPVEGESYYFYLEPTAADSSILDYAQIGDYFSSIAPIYMMKTSEEPCDEMKVILDYQKGDDVEKAIVDFFK